MASVSITNQTLTMTITIDGVDTVIRKDNCKVQAFGDVVRITDYKGSIYEFLFSDCTSPSEASANDLRDAIEEFLNTGGGGGGGGITSITSTDGSIDIDNTDPSAPDLSIAIPIIIESSEKLTQTEVGDDLHYMGFNDDGEYGFQVINQDTGKSGRFTASANAATITATNPIGGLNASVSVGVNESNEAVVEIQTNKFAIFGQPATSQAAAILDATNATDVITQLNTLLAAMRAYGLIAE